jgi:hypothetical protein
VLFIIFNLKKIYKIILLVLILMLILCFEIFMRSIPNSYSFKDKWMKKNASSVEVLVLGSSSAYYGIDPKYIARETFNLANVSQDLTEDCFLLRKYRKNESNLKYVILVMSDASMLYTIQSGIEGWREDYYGIYMHYPPKILSTEIASEWMVRKLKSYLKGDDMQGCDRHGFGTAYKLAAKPKWDEVAATDAVKRSTYLNPDGSIDTSNLKRNRKAINTIATICKDKGAKLLIISSPFSQSCWSKIDERQIKIFHREVNCLIKHIPGVVYFFDFTKDPRFFNDDFYDGNHLTDVGAKKFSQIINKEILN